MIKKGRKSFNKPDQAKKLELDVFVRCEGANIINVY